MLKVVADEAGREDLAAGLDEIVREGARRMLAAALEEEVAAYIAVHAAERDGDGRRLVVLHRTELSAPSDRAAIRSGQPPIVGRLYGRTEYSRRRARSPARREWLSSGRPLGSAAAGTPLRRAQCRLTARASSS